MSNSSFYFTYWASRGQISRQFSEFLFIATGWAAMFFAGYCSFWRSAGPSRVHCTTHKFCPYILRTQIIICRGSFQEKKVAHYSPHFTVLSWTMLHTNPHLHCLRCESNPGSWYGRWMLYQMKYSASKNL